MFPTGTEHKTRSSNQCQQEAFLPTLEPANPGAEPPLQNHSPLQSQGEKLSGLLQNISRGREVRCCLLLTVFFCLFEV